MLIKKLPLQLNHRVFRILPLPILEIRILQLRLTQLLILTVLQKLILHRALILLQVAIQLIVLLILIAPLLLIRQLLLIKETLLIVLKAPQQILLLVTPQFALLGLPLSTNSLNPFTYPSQSISYPSWVPT